MEILVWLLRALWAWYERSRIDAVLAKHQVPAGTLQISGSATPAAVEAYILDNASRLRQYLTGLLATGVGAFAQVDDLERELDLVAGGALLRDLVQNTVRTRLGSGLQALRVLEERARTSPAGWVIAQPGAAAIVSTVLDNTLRVQVLSALARARRDPSQGLAHADADAIASSLLEPIQQFARDQGLPLPASVPFSVPAAPGGEAIWFGLLPTAYPILFVPADFERDLFRYASVPHELGHLLWRDVPGLASELRRALHLPPPDGQLGIQNGRIVGSVSLLYGAWLEEVWADAVAVLLLGPAALRGLAFSFASPADPSAVVTVALDEHGRLDEHPPAHLRIHLAAHLLARMGYEREAGAIRDEWDTQHAAPTALFLPIGANGVRAGLEHVLAPGRELLETLYMAELGSLSGFRLVDIPGFEMSPGQWARVQRRSEQLTDGKPFNDDGRVVLAAAIEARARRPGSATIITRGLRQAILGRGTDERRVADPRYAGTGRSPRGFAHEVRQAMLLREVLYPRRARPGLRR